MITAITILIAVLGALLLLILFIRIRETERAFKLDKYRSKDTGFADLLVYAAVVEDGIIVGKNGALMAAWQFCGADTASSTDVEREQVSLHINQALSRLGNGWMIHVDAIRKPAQGYSDKGLSNYPDPVTAAIDQERRELFERIGELYESCFVVTLTFLPPMLAQRKFVEMMFDDDTANPDFKSRTKSLLQYFERECTNFESRLSSTFELTRLKSRQQINEDGNATTLDDFLSWLQLCITGNDQPMVLPSNPMYLDTILGGQEMWGGVVPKVGRNFIQTVSIEGFPLESTPGMLNILSELPGVYRWSSRYIFMDTHEAVAHLDQYRKKWKQKIRGFFDQVFNLQSSHVDEDALNMTEDAQSAIAETNSGFVAQGYYTSVVVLMMEDRAALEDAARKVEKAINHLGFAARIETINTMEAYLGSLPGHGVENVRRPLINTMNLADLLPVNTIWTGKAQAPCPMYPPNSPPLMHCVTQGATPFRLNLHVRDLGHTFMFGPTGAGKSTHLALIAAQLRRYKNMSVYCFDKGLSMYPLTKAVGGQHFTVAGDDEALAFCPLQFLESKGDRAWALEWICTMVELNGITVSPQQRNEISLAITNMHQSGSHTLSDFLVTIQDEAIREALKQYTIDGMMGHLLDAEEDGLHLSSFTTFEIEELMNLGEKYALPTLLYLFRRIERSLQGQPAAILLDEAWLMLGHPVFRAKIREWLKVMRKNNCLVLMATQSLSDAANSGILDVIVESTATKIFLPNVFARDEEAAALYRRMGLNARQIEILAAAVPKQHYYTVSENGRRLYELALGPLALAFVGSTDKESIATIKNLYVQYGDRWVDQWLAMKGLKLSDYGVAA
ncbi:MAG: VirB4 family type IV secretion/conjugal transfer ATPase [Nitrosomonas sp. PRO4]|uniref:Type IV secretion system protein virB4 n=1 Tax=Nitrosomonas nitrosa TaxID=52442 RepID=A0A8H8Z160_9PROT|nr:VirB4 family type IV secretion/conjugal transfer ATPase [Nitrosomonas nitrosa]MCB1937310.1 VirB4 family type IV secretion/conjugal transfer ATPase [Nitrosomonas sp.]MCE7913960.1 VirB4 family type IV secretion/conjugal transfer ATPase [Nitrosomonas sp. PRO4]CAE6507978.1 Conjugal transfer protein TrbE [Nitrosomonas nitrosa]